MSEPQQPAPRTGLTEDQLRERLHRAVAAVQPAPGALPRLRVAVPRRRAGRRRALGGAALLAAAVAVLPVVHAAQPFRLSGDSAGGQAAPGTGASPGHSADTRTGHPRTAPVEPPATAPGASPDTSAAISAGTAPGLPPAGPAACIRAELGRVDAQQAAADPATGKVYGWFRLTNTGGRLCRVPGSGLLALGAGSTDVQLLAHTAGDPAGALPDPATLPHDPVLVPGDSYLVRFAWVPARCGTSSATPSGPAATQQPAPGTSTEALPAAETPTTAAALATDPSPGTGPSPSSSPAPTTFTLAFTPDPAAGPAATTALPTTCGGTLYWTGPEPSPTPPTPTPAATSTP